MGYLDDNGLARLWDKIKNHIRNTKNVIAPAPNVPKDISGDTVFLNHVAGGEIASSHLISGTGGTRVVSHSSGTDNFDGVIEISSAGVNVGKFVNDSITTMIDTGFAETPKMLKLYCFNTNEGTLGLVAECYPHLDAPFNLIVHGMPIGSITFNGGVATVNWHTSTGLSCMWEAYI